MAKRKMSTPAQHKKGILERTKFLREQSGLTREEIVREFAAHAGAFISIETYKKYETRTPIPHSLIIAFCEIVGGDPYFLLTGGPFRLGKGPSSSGDRGDPKKNAA
jgi:transcriptional regulator with XRE-family HTH domain